MILIYEVKTQRVPDDARHIYLKTGYPIRVITPIERATKKCSDPLNSSYEERISVRTFERDSERISIGMIREVEREVGMPFLILHEMRDEMENLRLFNSRLRAENMDLSQTKARIRKQRDAYRDMTFWQRLKFLLTGKFREK